MYQTCVGCVLQGEPCLKRDAVRRQLKGLGVKSIRWTCPDRKPKYMPGDLVWARTVADKNAPPDEISGEPYRDFYPAVVVENRSNRLVVFIKPGTPGRESGEETKFCGEGFCRIPLVRIEPRAGDREAVCPHCRQPQACGHADAYFCSQEAKRQREQAVRAGLVVDDTKELPF